MQPIDLNVFFQLDLINWDLILTWEELGKIFGIYIVTLIIFGLWRASSVLVIEGFSDDTGSDEKNKITGLDTLLITELNRINRLYKNVDEQRPIATSTGECRQISAVLMVDGPGDMLPRAESTGTKISLGPIEVPVGLLLTIFNTLSRGPRIRGSIRKGEEGFILLATISGVPRNISWKATGKIPPDKEPATPANDPNNNISPSIEIMVRELACRIFTDISSTGSPKWEATYLFNKGLHSYRECLRTPKDQVKNLKDAETYFQQALLYDNKFTSAWYNLGVVYSECGQKTAARNAFLRSIEQDPNQPKAYYALAQTQYQLSLLTQDVLLNQDAQLPRTFDCQIQVLRRYCRQACELHYRNNLSLALFNRLSGLIFASPLQDFCMNTKTLQNWLYGWVFSLPSTLLAQNLDLVGLTYLRTAESIPDEQQESPEECTTYAIYFFEKAVAAAWKRYSSISSFGIDNDYFQKKQLEDMCRILANTISDLGWAYILDAYLNPHYTESYQAKQSLDGAEWLLNYAITINSDLKIGCTCPELHWRLGVARLCNNNPQGARDAFQAAIQINPEVMKYHMSLIFAWAVDDDSHEVEPGCMNDALQYAVKSFDNEIEHKDDQWRSLDLLQKMIVSGLPADKDKTTCKSIYIFYKTLRQFIELNHIIIEILDFYEVDFRQIVSIKIPELKKIVEQYNEYCINPQSPESFIPYEEFIKWMCGHIHLAEGRWNYYEAINKPPINYDEIELLYDIAENEYIDALNNFRNFPEECPWVYSRIGLVRTLRNSHDYCSALSKITTAHELKPTGDYEHVIQGTFASTLEDYKEAIDYFEEALRRAYDLPTYSQYFLNNYFTKLANSHINLAKKSDDDNKKKYHFDEALRLLDQAQEIFTAGYNKALQPDQELLNLNHTPQLIQVTKVAQYFRSIIATRFWKANIYKEKEEYPNAILHYNIVNSFYKPRGCQDKHCNKIRTTTITEWPGYKEYVITLLLLGQTYYQSKKYDLAQKSFDKILEYETLIIGSDKRRFFGRRIWYRTHPYRILIEAYLYKIRLCVDLNIVDPHIPNWLNRVKSLNNDLNGVKDDAAQKNIHQNFEVNNLLDQESKSVKAGLEKHCGLVALQFNYPDVKDNTSPILTKYLKPSSSSIHIAIESFESAIALQSEPETYVFLLKAIEKKIDFLKNNASTNYISNDSSSAEEVKKTKIEISTSLQKATKVLEALKNLNADQKTKDFIDEFSKKIQNWSKTPEGDSKKDHQVVYCTVTPPQETGI